MTKGTKEYWHDVAVKRGQLLNKLEADNGKWKQRALRAEEAIKGCAVGPCPTLARLAMEDMGWDT